MRSDSSLNALAIGFYRWERRFMLVFAGNDEGVEEIECDRFDPHYRITRAGAW